MTVSLLVAVARNGVIGRDNELPWRLPADLTRFKELTWGRTVILGRRTWESIGRPLPGRRFVLVTSRPGDAPPGVTAVASLQDALAACAGEEEVFVIGGARLFAQALAVADRLYVTRVEAEPPGDVFFPEVDWSRWRLLEETRREPDAANAHAMVFQRYERVPLS
jgi:dihydrofolate reductase